MDKNSYIHNILNNYCKNIYNNELNNIYDKNVKDVNNADDEYDCGMNIQRECDDFKKELESKNSKYNNIKKQDTTYYCNPNDVCDNAYDNTYNNPYHGNTVVIELEDSAIESQDNMIRLEGDVIESEDDVCDNGCIGMERNPSDHVIECATDDSCESDMENICDDKFENIKNYNHWNFESHNQCDDQFDNICDDRFNDICENMGNQTWDASCRDNADECDNNCGNDNGDDNCNDNGDDNSDNNCNNDSDDNRDDAGSCSDNNDESKKCDPEEMCRDIYFLQNRVNYLNDRYSRLKYAQRRTNRRYKKIMDEIYDIAEDVEANNENIVSMSSQESCVGQTNRIYLDNCKKVTKIKICIDIRVIFVSMAGGGGAGGIGCVRGNKYISGGGGGSGMCCIKKPINVKKGYTLKVKVGSGGSSMKNINGRDTYIKVYGKCKHKYIGTITACGGQNGNPTINHIYSSDMDVPFNGGKTMTCNEDSNQVDDTNTINLSNDGQDGQLTFPSQTALCAGDGGNNVFFEGGAGGSNIFNSGGTRGIYEEDKYNGEDGNFGSGGGGSCPRLGLEDKEKLSGSGGNGFVLIEW